MTFVLKIDKNVASWNTSMRKLQPIAFVSVAY